MAELDRSLNNFINYLRKDKMDKILKFIELTKAIMATQKSENQQITKKMEELTMSWDGFVKNCAKTNAATIHSPPVRSTDNTKEFKDMQIALKHLNTKIDAQEAEILCLKNDLAKLTSMSSLNKTLIPPQANLKTHTGLSIGNQGALALAIPPSNPSSPAAINHNCKITAVITLPKFTAFVSKLAPGTTTEDLLDYLKSTFGESNTFKIDELKVQSQEYCSFKVETDPTLQNTILDLKNWPKGVVVKKFKFFRQPTHISNRRAPSNFRRQHQA